VIRTPFTPYAHKTIYHILFILVCCGVFFWMYLFDRRIEWVYWGGGLVLGALGGFLQVWGVEEVIHERRGSPSWREFGKLVGSTKWGKAYLANALITILLILYLGRGVHGGMVENVMADYLAFMTAKEIVTMGERHKLEKAFSFREKRFEWVKLPRFREHPVRRFIRRWFHFG